ncbi:MAG: type II toxin-antitoxin system RnlA family toxin [Candidatus Aenigmarchaeota archaeon]|nr:type II toxin-antitoxin system RnlA family toxin [Candidatus Aenigmarchaeota archaeon]
MSQTNSSTFKIAEVFKDYCDEKHYQVQQSKEEHNLRLDISNLSERTIVKIFHKGTLQVQGKQNSLKAEIGELKEKFESNPQSFLGYEIAEIKACATRYDVMLLELRTKIKESLDVLEAKLEFTGKPKPNVEYRAKITRNESSLTLTQFNNGTLLLQGKEDELFDNSCDLIEKIANPSDKEVISRFISSDEENLKNFVAKYSPELINLAENNVSGKIGNVFNYLEPYDKKWFVASECLCLTKIPLPEFSPLVMPASKAFEGFAKKLLVDIGLFKPDHLKSRTANFSALKDKDNSKRKDICAKEIHANTMLKKIDLCLDMNRNFMMHSDDSKITKVDSQQEAEEKVNIIFKETKEIFDYFNDLFNLFPR